MIIDESTISVSALLSEIDDLNKELKILKGIINQYRRFNTPGML